MPHRLTAEDILFQYTPDSRARELVLTMCDAHMYRQLHDLCVDVSAMLVDRKPIPDDVVTALALFLEDIPEETRRVFNKECWVRQAGVSSSNRTYLQTLYALLSKHPDFRKRQLEAEVVVREPESSLFVKASCGCIVFSTKIGDKYLVLEICDRDSYDYRDIAWIKRDLIGKTFTPLDEAETYRLLGRLVELIHDGHKFQALKLLLS